MFFLILTDCHGILVDVVVIPMVPYLITSSLLHFLTSRGCTHYGTHGFMSGWSASYSSC